MWIALATLLSLGVLTFHVSAEDPGSAADFGDDLGLAKPDEGLDRGVSEADARLSREIREKVAANMTLSPLARNVVIETRDGVVALRGPVRSDEEKTYIATVAQATAGVVRVDNLIEIEVQD